ncbi:twin-arginine translocation signal domain-containing protein [Actinomadura sp. NPDC049753]|uniref:twin-arginine translocation signal domain-containing protein n=1 Tax=Actinomadura sp. NPDC049753 TaxID=3154739 RepID=UPI0034303179
MGDSKITRRQVIGAAAVGAVLAVTGGKDKDEEKKCPPQEAPRSGDSTTEQPKR